MTPGPVSRWNCATSSVRRDRLTAPSSWSTGSPYSDSIAGANIRPKDGNCVNSSTFLPSATAWPMSSKILSIFGERCLPPRRIPEPSPAKWAGGLQSCLIFTREARIRPRRLAARASSAPSRRALAVVVPGVPGCRRRGFPVPPLLGQRPARGGVRCQPPQNERLHAPFDPFGRAGVLITLDGDRKAILKCGGRTQHPRIREVHEGIEVGKPVFDRSARECNVVIGGNRAYGPGLFRRGDFDGVGLIGGEDVPLDLLLA